VQCLCEAVWIRRFGLNPVGFGRTIVSMHCSNFLLTCEEVSGLCSYRKIAET
jgi:hypothetical protein